jgi:6-pyruvoyltetrahydropterin/6-carboxytetrahydropterin synthase
MFRVTRRYGFPASHRLHSPALSEEANRGLYGKCANPYGHGHNYEVEVSARGPLDETAGRAIDTRRLDALVHRVAIEPFAHRNLNTEVAAFQTAVPTSENLGLEIFGRIAAHWKEVFPGEWPRLDRVRITETPRNVFEVTAQHEIE